MLCYANAPLLETENQELDYAYALKPNALAMCVRHQRNQTEKQQEQRYAEKTMPKNHTRTQQKPRK